MIEALVGLDRFVINGLRISSEVSPTQLHGVLGAPDRIVDPASPAPYGHRNNQIHVYDRFGLYFNEHHRTELAQSITFVSWPEEEGFPFSPSEAFAGGLTVDMYRLPSNVTEGEVLRECPISWECLLKGNWWAKLGEIRVGFYTKGEKLKSGRRSPRRRVVSFDVLWPHDPRQSMDDLQ